jgi:hypothetical protein
MISQQKPRFLMFLLGLVLVALMAACGGNTPAAQPTPTPTPEPPPLQSEPFLDLPANATFGDVMERLPADERACVEQDLGSDRYQQFLDEPAFESDALGLQDMEINPACFSRESLVGLLTAGIAQQAGGLSDGTVRCIEGTFAGFDLSQFQQENAAPPQDQAGIFGALTGLLLCLTPEEAERIELGSILGGEAPPLSLQDLRCVLQRVDVNVFTDLFTTLAGDPTAQPDFEALSRLSQAFQACGVSLDLSGGA